MIDFTKFDGRTGEILAWCQISHAELIGAQLQPGEAVALDKHGNPASLFQNGKCLYCAPDGLLQLIDRLQKEIK